MASSPSVELSDGINGLSSVILHQLANGFRYSAEILLYGGQVISWMNQRGEELLFQSERTVFEPPHPIRGGIPICFPRFFGYGDVEDHGFARTRMWRLENLIDDMDFPPPHPDNAFADFILDNMPDDFPHWPYNHRFELRLRVILAPCGDLTMISRVKNVNTNGEPFSFKFVYHTYFAVSNIRATQVEGLEGVGYVDCLEMHERFIQDDDPITFVNELDRIYLNTPDEVCVRDRQDRRTYTITKNAGLPEIVVYNPWDSRNLADFGNHEYKWMVCVEAAAVDSEITLNPDEEWTGMQRLSFMEF
ncbi:hypothetical protein ACP275_04G172800 [Erythranthe tilingii]